MVPPVQRGWGMAFPEGGESKTLPAAARDVAVAREATVRRKREAR